MRTLPEPVRGCPPEPVRGCPPEERMRRVADIIDARPEAYDQRSFTDMCGTTACIAHPAMIDAGYTVRRGSFYTPRGRFVPDETEEARLLLGLSQSDAEHLFYGSGPRADHVTVPQALREIADGAKVTDVWVWGYYDRTVEPA